MPPVKQKLLVLLEHLSSPRFFGGVRVARSLVFRVELEDTKEVSESVNISRTDNTMAKRTGTK